jgi:hypothetical protein
MRIRDDIRENLVKYKQKINRRLKRQPKHSERENHQYSSLFSHLQVTVDQPDCLDIGGDGGKQEDFSDGTFDNDAFELSFNVVELLIISTEESESTSSIGNTAYTSSNQKHHAL